MRYYYPASECKFYSTQGKFPIVSLPSECRWLYGNGFLRFAYEGKEYRLGLSPEGNLQGFLEPINPDDLAAVSIVKVRDDNNITQYPFARSRFTEEGVSSFIAGVTAEKPF